MSEWIWCPKCGSLMNEITSGHICPLCGYRVPAQTITTTTGTSVEYVPVIRCKVCRFFERDHFDAVYFPTESGEAQRVPIITAHEICTRWGDGCKTSADGYCFMAERKEE